MKRWIRGAGLGIAVALAALGCAEERAPINRVQANVLKKSFFVGEKLNDTSDDPEFYAEDMLVDTSYGSGMFGIFSNFSKNPSRIKWVIEEDVLIGRMTYQRIDGADDMGLGVTSKDGQVVVAFPITKHFDIRRSYNPSTGEELNVVEENTGDRPWYEREYFRVDWSTNLNTNSYDFDTLSMLGIYGSMTYTPLKYFVTDPTHPDAPHFDDGYFDVTTKAFAAPGMLDLSHLGWGIKSFPACMLPPEFSGGKQPVGNCNPVEVTVRHSFRKVVDTDYEPMETNGVEFASYGAFITERRGYNRRYGMTDTQWHRFVTRYNIWERSHYYDDPEAMTGAVECNTPTTNNGDPNVNPHADLDGNGTEDQCEAVTAKVLDADNNPVGGSRCDAFKQRCTLPYRARTVKPIAFHFTHTSNKDYLEATETTAHDWDAAMRVAVRSAQWAECAKTGSSPADCDAKWPIYHGQQDENEDVVSLTHETRLCKYGKSHAGEDCNGVADRIGQLRGYSAGVIDIAKMDEVVVFCHDPVAETDHKACGAPGTIARQGDIRYHHLNIVEHAESPSPWGYGPTTNDPLSGEIISGRANTWSHVNDLFAQGVIDKLRFIAGELTRDQIVPSGKYVQDWVKADELASKRGMLPQMTKERVEEKLARISNVTRKQYLKDMAELNNRPEILNNARRIKEEVQHTYADASAPATNPAIYEAHRKLAVGTSTEAGLNTKMMQAFAGTQSFGLSGPQATRLSSPLQGAHPGIARALRHLREINLAKRGQCVMEEFAPSPTGLIGLRYVLESKFGKFNPNDSPADQRARADKMAKYMARRAHYAVTLHELGHTFGLRHNFVTSWDSYNYRPQYWQLRTKDGSVTQECTSLAPDGNTCIGPRYFDPTTDEERNNLIHMFMNSSTMDYAGELSQDFLGLGAYDYGAAKFFYGGVISVYNNPDYAVGTGIAGSLIRKMDNFGGITGLTYNKPAAIKQMIDGVPMPMSTNMHYSQLQKDFNLISNCKEVNHKDWVPSDWNVEKNGKWSPVLDGYIVNVNGKYTRCDTQQVDYKFMHDMRKATTQEIGAQPTQTFLIRGGHNVEAGGTRIRVPHGFATDGWADLGNLSVYRHDNGADPYELFNFFITEQEVNHIFDNFRRNRSTFSVRSAANRILSRYNEKMRDGAKGLGLYANLIRNASASQGSAVDTTTTELVTRFFPQNTLASAMAFDHFTRIFQRPEPGPHFRTAVLGETGIWRSSSDPDASIVAPPGGTGLIVSDGPTGYWNDVSFGGKLIENQLSDDQGEFNRNFTMTAGSYYDKMNVSMLLTESVDNFISDSRGDFTDPRTRAVSMADLFPNGYRRWLANNLTNDEYIKGAKVLKEDNPDNPGEKLVAVVNRDPKKGDIDLRLKFPIAWTSWYGSEPTLCLPASGSQVCGTPGLGGSAVNAGGTTIDFGDTDTLDPQVDYEQQKFLVAWTLMYLPENQYQTWLDQMAIYDLGKTNNPGFANRIELHDPLGRTYIAQTFGTESIFNRTVQRGIAARMLEYANRLLFLGYETDPVDYNNDGTVDWYVAKRDANGQPIPKAAAAGGNPLHDAQIARNRLAGYVSVLSFMRQAIFDMGLSSKIKGFY